MTSLDSPRSPLDQAALATLAGSQWKVSLHEEAPSTNALAAAGPAGAVVVADHQTAGRGRLDRDWLTPAGSALTFSAVVDPGVADQHWPLLPLVTGIAVATAIRSATELPVSLKWPNDVLVNDRKVCGILVERVPGSGAGPLAVIGIGINVDITEDELAATTFGSTATSLSIEGSAVSRTDLFGSVLAALTEELAALEGQPTTVVDSYRPWCGTLGQRVDVHLPDGSTLTGEADSIDAEGRLVVQGPQGPVAVGAGDVVHVRPAV